MNGTWVISMMQHWYHWGVDNLALSQVRFV
jgi:hypothetical protein